MAKNLLVINVDIRETRVALIENGIIAELHIERESSRGTLGNIYLGKVSRVLPGMQAAFIDVGLERAAFLHVEDLIRPDDFDAYLAGHRAPRDERPAAPGVPADEAVEEGAGVPIELPTALDVAESPGTPFVGDEDATGDPLPDAAFLDAVPIASVSPPTAGTGVVDPLDVPLAAPEDDDDDDDETPLLAPRTDQDGGAAGSLDDDDDDDDEPQADQSAQHAAALDDDDDDDRDDDDDDDDDDNDDAEETPRLDAAPQPGDPELPADEGWLPATDLIEDEPSPEPPPIVIAAEGGALASPAAAATVVSTEEEDARAGGARSRRMLRSGRSARIRRSGRTGDRAPNGAQAQDQQAQQQPQQQPQQRGRDGREGGGGRDQGGRGRGGGGGRGGDQGARARDQGGRGRDQGGNRGRDQGGNRGRDGGKGNRDQARSRDRDGGRGRDGRKGNHGEPQRISKQTPIREVVREGQEVVVQISKEPIGTKGARVTSHISLPGRYVVYLPTVDHIGISKRIGSDKERSRLRDSIDAMKPPKGGLIVRTLAEGLTKKQLKADVGYLVRLWGEVAKKREVERRAPACLYQELDLILKTARDLFSDDIEKIVIDDREQYMRLRRFVEMFMPERAGAVEYYDGEEPIFDAYGIEDEIARALARKVPLPSGGHLIIDQAEALTAIDVNTGRFVGKGSKDLEDTILKTNLEAVEEIAYQLRFRNLGGLIILDLIDMERAANREKVRRHLEQLLGKDKAKTTLNRISDLGLIEMTRKRTRESLGRTILEPCFYCDGTGQLQSKQTVAYEILRQIRRERMNLPGYKVVVNAHPAVIDLLKNDEREAVAEAEKLFTRRIELVPRKEYHLEQFDLQGR